MSLIKSEIDIILPIYNSEKYIDETINSIFLQSFKNWKLIMVDDASNLATKKKILKYRNNKKIKIYFLPKNKGAAYCRNLAIKKAKSKYLAFIDSDDKWSKNKLKMQLDFMKKNKFDFTYTYYKSFGLANKKIIPKKRYTFSTFIKDTSIATSTMMIKRNIVKNIFFTNTEVCEDYFFKCRLLKKVGFAEAVKRYLTFYRVRKGSLQSNRFRNIFWIWKINNYYNKLSLLQNMVSILSISINSIKKYGFKQ